MTNNYQMNMLAIEAKNGSQESFDKLATHYLTYISKFTDAAWYRMSNEASFECRCIQRLKQALKTFDPDKDDFDSLAKFRIKQAFLLFLKLGKRKTPKAPLSIEKLKEKSEEDNESNPFDIEDKRAESEIYEGINAKEIVSTLAGGDLRKEIILSCWSEGIYNETKISELVAQRLGGNVRSHCKYLQRFRDKCKSLLIEMV